MRKDDEAKKVFGVIVILAIIMSVFGDVVSAEGVSVDLAESVAESVADVEIQTAAGNLNSEELTKALDADLLHQLPATSGKISCFCLDCCPTSAWGEPL